MGHLVKEGNQIIWYIFSNMAIMDSELDSEHLSASDCHSSGHNSRDISERIVAGDYVLKKENTLSQL